MKTKKSKIELRIGTLDLGEKEIEYTMRRTRNAKKIRLAVSAQRKIIISLPWYVSFSAGQKFVHSKINWLQEAFARLPQISERKKVMNGSIFSFFGRRYELRAEIAPEHKRSSCRVAGQIITIRCKNQTEIERVLETWLKKETVHECSTLVETYAHQLGVRGAKTRAMKAATRWGSCSLKTRTIAINMRLALAPVSVLEYVVAHEVSHLVQQNHSQKFWHTVKLLCPEYKKELMWLKKNGALLVL